MGHPVVGDPVYGFKKQKISVEDGQLLHARTLAFTHPRTGEEMSFDAPLPKTFEETIEKLSKKYAVEVKI
jgi:23S rRNA pseudouridine1911/1915/1917 synthase